MTRFTDFSLCKSSRVERAYPTMAVIYTPKGRAREYSPKALNIYLGCTHGCRYCYAPRAIQKPTDTYFQIPFPRRDIIPQLGRQLGNEDVREQVLLSFVGDCYCETADGGRTVREALIALREHAVPVAILTKGGTRCLRDIGIFRSFGDSIMVGATLTFLDPAKSSEWEPGAASPQDRIRALKALKAGGIKTFASFEPVIDPAESLAVMRETVREDCVDLYKVGKLNGMKSIEAGVNWSAFLREALSILREAGKEIYVKEDLRRAAPDVMLTPEETDADLHTVCSCKRRLEDYLEASP